MDSVLTLLGLVILAIFIWKSKLSLGWKKLTIGFLIVAIIGNVFILMTGQTVGSFIHQLISR